MSVPCLITFGIPTYNGSEYIRESLDSIVSQLGPADTDIDILICDNASTDALPAIVESYTQKYGFVHYHRNPTNLGFDANCDIVFRQARGRYVWLLGDDDYLLPGALARVRLLLLAEPELAAIVQNLHFRNIETGQVEQPQTADADVFCKNGDEFFQRSLWRTAAIAAMIVRRQDWIVEDMHRWFGTSWIHIGGLLQIMRGNSRSAILAEPSAVVRVANPRWASNTGNQLRAGLRHLAVLEALPSLGYHCETFEVFRKARFSKNVSDIVGLAPAQYMDRLRTIAEMGHFFCCLPRFWLLDTPLLLTPRPVLNSLRAVARKIRRVGRPPGSHNAKPPKCAT